jgi:hypothetical protein
MYIKKLRDMLKLVSKQKIAKNEWEGKLLLNGKVELTFYKFNDGDASGTSIYYNDEVVGDDVESVDGVDSWDIVDAAISILR